MDRVETGERRDWSERCVNGRTSGKGENKNKNKTTLKKNKKNKIKKGIERRAQMGCPYPVDTGRGGSLTASQLDLGIRQFWMETEKRQENQDCVCPAQTEAGCEACASEGLILAMNGEKDRERRPPKQGHADAILFSFSISFVQFPRLSRHHCIAAPAPVRRSC